MLQEVQKRPEGTLWPQPLKRGYGNIWHHGKSLGKESTWNNSPSRKRASTWGCLSSPFSRSEITRAQWRILLSHVWDMEIQSLFMCTNAWGPFCPLHLLALAGALPHRFNFLRGRRHNHMPCIAFSHHFLSKEVNKKWHLVLSVVGCSLLTLLCEGFAKQSPLPNPVFIRMVDHGWILSEQPLSSTESMCSTEKCDDYSETPLSQSWLGFFWLCGTSAQVLPCQQHWCANIKSQELGTGSDSARWWAHRTGDSSSTPRN